MDRIFVHRIDATTQPWFDDLLARHGYRPSNRTFPYQYGTYCQLKGSTETLLPLLEEWVLQELVWQLLPDAAERCSWCTR